MGNKSTVSRSEITNIIDNTIENYTTNINKVTQQVTNKSMNELYTNNTQNIKMSCNSTNKIKIDGCKIKGLIKFDQIANISCLHAIVSKIKTDTSWQKEFASTLNNEFANAVKNDNSLINDMVAKNYLEKLKESEGLNGMLQNIGETVGGIADSLLGTNVSTEDVTIIKNEIITHFKNVVIDESDVKNIIENISKNKVNVDNISTSKIDPSAINDVELTNCELLGEIGFNQNSSIKSMQNYGTDIINNNTLSDVAVMDALTKITNDTKNKNDVKNDEDTDNTLKDNEKTKGGLLDLLGLGNFSSIIIYIIIICIIIAAGVVGFKLMKSKSQS